MMSESPLVVASINASAAPGLVWRLRAALAATAGDVISCWSVARARTGSTTGGGAVGSAIVGSRAWMSSSAVALYFVARWWAMAQAPMPVMSVQAITTA